MIRFRKPHLISLILSLAIIHSIQAEEGPPVQAELSFAIWNDGFNLRDIIEKHPKMTGQTVYLASSDQVVIETEARFGHFGPSVNYTGNEEVALYSRKPEPNSPLPSPVANFKLNAQANKQIVVLFPEQNGQLNSYHSLVVECPESGELELKTIHIQNLFAKTLYLQIGSDKFALESHERRMIRVTENMGRGVNLQAVVKDDDTQRARPLIRRFIRIDPGESYIAFILPHPLKVGAAEMRLIKLPES